MSVNESATMANVIVPRGLKSPFSKRKGIAGNRVALGIVGVLLFLGLWQLIVTVGGLPQTILPPPLAVLTSLVQNLPLLLSSSVYTLATILIGFALSVLVGVGLAIALRASPLLDGLMTPVIVGLQTVPKIALLPLLLAWFGIGQTTGLVIVVMLCVFPVLVNTRLGLSSIDDQYRSLGRVMGGSRSRIFWAIEIPLALPAIFGGLEVAMTMAVTGAAASEFFAGSDGIAYLTQVASSTLRMDLAFASLIVLTALGILLYYLIKVLGWIVMPWTRGRR